MSAAPFPSLIIRGDALIPRGSFAESQAIFLNPDPAEIVATAAALREKNLGVVAHFYMDAELQGVLTAVKNDWPHIHISDSLVMADRAVLMAESGVAGILVLGVDFMSENVRAVLDKAGHADVPVYRVAEREIGCSLAESAEALAYGAWLHRAAKVPNSLHVIYINTGLDVKGRSHSIVPTITCTSSNVVQTILQATAQVPDLHIWYGPDTYMGENLFSMFTRLARCPDEEIAALHPAHNQRTLSGMLERFDYFKQGNCIVHHMFGTQVVEKVRREYADAYHTAHLEVPGEMFALATEAARTGRGVVGSTSNILNFIADELEVALEAGEPARLQFVLGTEAGMITAIVDRIQARLAQAAQDNIDVEIIFPVSDEALTIAPEFDLGIIPGVAGGEGCSTAGGCATCPYMKMNSLDAMSDVISLFGTDHDLQGFEPKKYTEFIAGRTTSDIGSEPILHMRHFQRTGSLSADLLAHIVR
jgi:quinolinate synthase